jgi:hypothetical protein
MEETLTYKEKTKYRKRETGEIIFTDENFINYNSLPLDTEITDEVLDKHGFDFVVNVPAPKFDPIYEYVFWDEVEEKDGKYYMKWEIGDKRKEWKENPEIASEVFSHREKLLYETDWWALPENANSYTEKRKKYRQDLRDLTAQPNFPFIIDWPEYPN